MAASEQMPLQELAYIDPKHNIQREILTTFAEMCMMPVDQISIGTDGCSAPIFAVPLYRAALAYARLCDPETGNVLPEARLQACRQVTKAMIAHPDMVAGPERFDTLLMEVGQGRFVAKGGAEAFMGVGLMRDALGPGSPALGIAIKIADGGGRSSVLPAVTLEVLRQLGALSESDLEALSAFGTCFPVKNWRQLVVGRASPVFSLSRERVRD
jgi:L-asparaginase II